MACYACSRHDSGLRHRPFHVERSRSSDRIGIRHYLRGSVSVRCDHALHSRIPAEPSVAGHLRKPEKFYLAFAVDPNNTWDELVNTTQQVLESQATTIVCAQTELESRVLDRKRQVEYYKTHPETTNERIMIERAQYMKQSLENHQWFASRLEKLRAVFSEQFDIAKHHLGDCVDNGHGHGPIYRQAKKKLLQVPS